MGQGRSPLTRNGRRSSRFEDFGAGWDALQKSSAFFSKESNSDTWHTNELSGAEYDAVRYYTGNGYISMNGAMYTTPYEEMEPNMRSKVKALEQGLNKFVLTKGIQVTRQADFKIFGAQSGDKMTVQQIKDYIKANADPKDGTLQNNGFLSAGANNHGVDIDGSGLVIHFRVPPSKGAGAYVNPISSHSGSSENEFLFNSNARFKFDTGSIHVSSDGNIHINAVWKGRSKKQAFKKKKK